ncbi:MAG: glycosyltransferase [Chloroflexia bacterium]
MKVLILSKALVLASYQRQLGWLARERDVELVAVVPPYWAEPGVGRIGLEQVPASGYRLLVREIAWNGHFHLYFWRALGQLLRSERPDVLHIDEESFNLATYQGMRWGVHLGARCLFFNWANIRRHLPPPFRWFERYNFAHAAYAVAGNREAASILQERGYRGPLAVIPQFGVDVETFCPGSYRPSEGFTVGYVGRLVPQKGVLDLLEAVARLPATVRLRLIGTGTLEAALRRRAETLGVQDRVEFCGRVRSSELPQHYREMDVLVLPSRTTPTWKEQFGRVVVEAMACAVPVVGSDSGEIPYVIGDAGLLFPEGNVEALTECLRALFEDAGRRHELGARGRERVLSRYSQERIAHAYLQVYRELWV